VQRIGSQRRSRLGIKLGSGGAGFAIGCATADGGGFSADAGIGVGGLTDCGVTAGGATPVTFSVPAGTGAPSGTRALGVPIVSGGFASGGRGGGTFSSVFFGSGPATVSAMIVDPTTVLARAVGVLSSAVVDAIGVDPTVTALSGLGAGAPASGFVSGGAGLNESRIF